MTTQVIETRVKDSNDMTITLVSWPLDFIATPSELKVKFIQNNGSAETISYLVAV